MTVTTALTDTTTASDCHCIVDDGCAMLQVPTREDLVVPTDHVVHTATKARLDRLDDLENQVTHC